MPFSVTAEVVEAWTLVRVVGDIDVLTAATLRGRLHALHQAGKHHLLFDLTQVFFMDSAGHGALLQAIRAARVAGGSTRIAGMGAHLVQSFAMMGLDRVVSLHTDVQQALGAVSDAPGGSPAGDAREAGEAAAVRAPH